MARTVAAVLIALLLWYLLTGGRAFQHHNTYLPLVPNTPAIQNLLADGERTWCVNANAANYPNLVTQLQQTYDSQQAKLGNANRRILGTYESATAADAAGCEVWWNGRYDNFCSGCAANVHYANWPVTVNMKLSLGYFEWRTTAGHEEGHVHGLHEQYIDNGSIQCDTSRTDTVMSCGTGVWELKPRDVGFICDLYGVPGDRFHACAPAPPECGPFPPVDHGGGLTSVYDSCTDIVTFNNGYTYSPSNGWWGYRDVGFAPCDAFGLRQVPVLSMTMPGLHSTFPWALGYWVTVPGCG
jgi:hypothetical protein